MTCLKLSNQAIIVISVFFVSAMLGCCKRQRVNTLALVKKYEKSNLCQPNNVYAAYIFPSGNIRFVKDDAHKCSTSFSRTLGIAHSIQSMGCDSDKVWHFVKTMNNLGIVGIYNHPGYQLFYSTYADSSYAQLKSFNKHFFDKQAELVMHEKKNHGYYRYVFIRANNVNDIPRFVKTNTTIHSISDGWFYYRTFNLNYINKF